MNFAHFSDTHIRVSLMASIPGTSFTNQMDNGSKLRTALRKAKEQVQTPELFLFSGDLVHEGTAADYEFFRKLVESELGGTPYFVALGNHDRHEAFWDGFMGELGKNSPYYSSGRVGGLRVISLDSSPTDGCRIGEMTGDQLKFLESELIEPAPLGSIVLMHHPAFCAYASFSGRLLRDGEKFAYALARSDVRIVCAGHVHFMNVCMVNNILHVTAPSTAFGMDVSGKTLTRFTSDSEFLAGQISAEGVSANPVHLGFGEFASYDTQTLVSHMTESPEQQR
jgi:3',5'-cyclic AMP phosphodiesterase CpdA